MMKKLMSALACAMVMGAAASAADHKTSTVETQSLLKELINSPDRPDKQKARDQYRRPFETLTFCGVEPDMTVVEVWPGGQGAWYRRILEPLMTDGGGQYFPVGNRSGFPKKVEDVPYGQADMVFVFRAHGFMIYAESAQTHVDSVFEMLRPGGVLCIVDHAGDESVPQDPEGENGYVNESHFFTLAKRAGFNILAASDHNRNPADATKDYPKGVWSLPPTLAGTLPLSGERKKFQEIGESDRFTHKYVKPE